MEYSVRKLDATDTQGARFRVCYRTEGTAVRTTVSYDFGASDPWLAAVAKATGKDASAFTETGPTGGMNRWFTDGEA